MKGEALQQAIARLAPSGGDVFLPGGTEIIWKVLEIPHNVGLIAQGGLIIAGCNIKDVPPRSPLGDSGRPFLTVPASQDGNVLVANCCFDFGLYSARPFVRSIPGIA